MSLALRGSVLEKAVLGLGLGFFLCPWPCLEPCVLNSTSANVNKNTALLLLDLKKAFDMVNHDLLLDKMNHYGVREIANNLFASFLASRKRYKFLNHTHPNYTGASNEVFLKAWFLVLCSLPYISVT